MIINILGCDCFVLINRVLPVKFYFEFCYSPGLLAQWVRVLSRYAKVVGSVPGQGNSHSLAGPLGAGRGRETGGAAGDLQPEGPWLAAGRTHPSIRPSIHPSIHPINESHTYVFVVSGTLQSPGAQDKVLHGANGKRLSICKEATRKCAFR